MEKQSIIDRGHEIITDAVARFRKTELAVSKNTALSSALEAMMRDLWALMSNPEETAAQREATEKQGLADAEAAAQAAIEPQLASPAEPAPIDPDANEVPLEPPANIDVDHASDQKEVIL